MSVRPSYVILFFISCFIAALLGLRFYIISPPASVALENGASIEWRDCWFKVPFAKVIHCGVLKPGLQNASLSMEQPFVLVRDFNTQHQDDPIIFVNGGPGASAYIDSDNISWWLENIKKYNWKRDFIILELRGTGLSKPKPECPELYNYYRDSLKEYEPLREEVYKQYSTFLSCKKRLDAEGYDLGLYSTYHNAHDVIDLMNSLSYKQYNLYGVSYGTRASLEIMRLQPARLRSVILDSAYPADKQGLQQWPWLLNNAIELIYSRCERNAECKERHPNARENLQLALTRLKEKPLTVTVYEGDTDKKLSDVVLSDHRFINAIFQASYDKWLFEDIIPATKAIADGVQTDALYRVVENFYYFNVDDSFNDMIYAAINCHDEGSISQQEYQRLYNQYPLTAEYHRYDLEGDFCRDFDPGFAHKLDLSPVSVATPALILAGELDPATPVAWGKQVHRGLPNSHFFEYKDHSHSVMDLEPCALKASREFLSNPHNSTLQPCGKGSSASASCQ